MPEQVSPLLAYLVPFEDPNGKGHFITYGLSLSQAAKALGIQFKGVMCRNTSLEVLPPGWMASLDYWKRGSVLCKLGNSVSMPASFRRTIVSLSKSTERDLV